MFPLLCNIYHHVQYVHTETCGITPEQVDIQAHMYVEAAKRGILQYKPPASGPRAAATTTNTRCSRKPHSLDERCMHPLP